MKLTNLNFKQRLTTRLREIPGVTVGNNGAVGKYAHPAVREMMRHFHYNYEVECPLLSSDEEDFIALIFNCAMRDQTYQPSVTILDAVVAINAKLALCGGNKAY